MRKSHPLVSALASFAFLAACGGPVHEEPAPAYVVSAPDVVADEPLGTRIQGEPNLAVDAREPESLYVHPEHGPDLVHAPGFAEMHANTASGPRSAVVFLATGGETIARGARAMNNAQANTSDIVPSGSVTFPPLSGAPWGLGRAAAAAQLAAHLEDDFADWDVTFVTTRPASGDYTMLVLGGTPGLLGKPSSYGGVAPYDVGDVNPNDLGFVFTDKLGAGSYSLRHVAWVVAHELAHTLGLNHIDRTGDIMRPSACFCQQSWGAGPVTGQPDRWQDDQALLSAVLLPASGAAAPPPASDSCFADVGASFAEDNICHIADLGITVGCGGDRYCPRAAVTRAQMAVFLDRTYRFATGHNPPAATTPFVDVAADHWAAASVARIYGLGITVGTGPNTYSPNRDVTRGQMAAFLARTYREITGAPAPVVATPFVDVAGHFAEADIARIYGLGITYGVSADRYGPDRVVTREQMAAFLSRLWMATD